MTRDKIDLDLFWMIRIGLFFVCSFLLCACSETPSPGRVYTGKDIEGYWATYPALHQSSLLSQMKNDTLRDFIRLYNDVNGNPDQTYRISGDTLFLLKFIGHSLRREWKFFAEFIILFATPDRLVLKEISSGTELIYYSLYDLPAHGEFLDQVAVRPQYEGENLVWNVDTILDSLTYGPGTVCILRIYPPCHYQKTDKVAFQRLQNMYARIDRSNLLFRTLEPPSGTTPLTPSAYKLELSGKRHYDVIAPVDNSLDPCVRAILSELNCFYDYCSRN